jgi:hypothetical protein
VAEVGGKHTRSSHAWYSSATGSETSVIAPSGTPSGAVGARSEARITMVPSYTASGSLSNPDCHSSWGGYSMPEEG